jgi:hypothetical protein
MCRRVDASPLPQLDADGIDGQVDGQVDRDAVNTARRIAENMGSRSGVAPGFPQSVSLARWRPMATRKQKPVDKQDRPNADTAKIPPIKTTLSLDAETYVKLHAKAAMRHVGISTLALEFIRAGLKGVVAFDRNESSDRGKTSDRQDGVGEISLDANEAA